MRKKPYDDDLLVELIASMKMTYCEIGRQVDRSASTIARIASGKYRADLQPRIRGLKDRNHRKVLTDNSRLQTKLVAAKAPKPPREDSKRLDYDDDLLVELLAAGGLSFKAISNEVGGVSAKMVGQIAKGERRPHLMERINRTFRANLRKTRNRGAHRLVDLLDIHADSGKGDDESARKCREFLLKTFLEMPCDEPTVEAAEPPFANFMKLSAETRNRIAADLGGPEVDDMEDEVNNCPG